MGRTWPGRSADALHVFQVPSGSEVATMRPHCLEWRYRRPSGRRTAPCQYYPLLVDGQPVPMPAIGGGLLRCALDPGAATVMAASADGRLALWQPTGLMRIGPEATEAEAPVALPVAMGPAKVMAWSPDGESLALVERPAGCGSEREGFGENRTISRRDWSARALAFG